MNIRVKLTRAENAAAHGVSKGQVVSLEIEQYLRHVVSSEAYPNWGIEALRAQAIACRTYALYHAQVSGPKRDYDVVDNTNHQSYWKSKLSPANSSAVDSTAGKVLIQNGKIICSEYAASNGGMSNSAGKSYYRSGYDGYTVRSGRKKSGHDRGMSQWGMQQAAKEGLSHIQILAYYYPNTQLVSSYNGSGSVATSTLTTSPVSNKGSQIVALARQQIGKPYILGKAGPNAFDCSGLVKYCYSAVAGILLPHGSTSMHKAYSNREVWTPSNPSAPWAAGDIVFLANKSSTGAGSTWSPTNYTTHVAIATGVGKRVVEARGTSSGILEDDWSGRSTLHSVIRLLDSSETSVVGADGSGIGAGGGGAPPIIPIPPIVNVSDIISGIVDNYKSAIDSVLSSKDRLGYKEVDRDSNAIMYGYLIDVKNNGEFKFILPDYSLSTSANYDSQSILGRSSPVKSYESTGEKSITIKVTLAAGTGVYGSSDGSMDPIDKIERDIRFVRSLLYPDYSKSFVLPPSTVVLILGNNERIRGVVTAVDTDYQRPFDSKGRYMVVELSFTVVEILPYPEDYSDVRKKNRVTTVSSGEGNG